ncbi:PDZ domain-containing protein [Simiduia aestuariiviva]|uniref:C-terminal processing protease CtpA/Prc n=1 Tax=Simiduia aestuariiviva TaxID=1510459 RepID=A0A839US38_9GAMM|nr:PDZ domain-containing protein [Simiduia aestuariiviva]MBB3169521.1 C-terminal processing protease CtpA/Prc [Simiduia aestuariiviva]
MQHAIRTPFLLVLPLLAALPSEAHAEGSIGIAAAVSTKGIFSPEIERFTISDVHKDSAAQAAGLKVGDQVVAIDGCRIPGCPAKKAKSLMSREPGEVLPLMVVDGSGSERLININVR